LLYGLDLNTKRKFVLDSNIRCRILHDIACGISFLHSCDIVHRDLKPSNIMIDSNFRARIGDFGLSRLVGSVNQFAAGTLPYMAPELISLLKEKGTVVDNLLACDVYSFGILVNEVISQSKPFEKLTEENCYERIVTNHEKPVFISKEVNSKKIVAFLEKLIESCCDPDPSKRISFSEMLDTEGLLEKIKKVLRSKKHSKKLRGKLEKKNIKEIEFGAFWKCFVKVFGSGVEKGHSFIKILLHVTEHNSKIPMSHVLRLCDWLENADALWIGSGFQKSFFVHHYIGEKTKEEVLNDETLCESVPKGTEHMAILYWERKENTFFVTVKCLTDKNKQPQHFLLKSQAINQLEKEVKEKVLGILRYKGSVPVLVNSSLFKRLTTGGVFSQAYTMTTGGPALSYIYVY